MKHLVSGMSSRAKSLAFGALLSSVLFVLCAQPAAAAGPSPTGSVTPTATTAIVGKPVNFIVEVNQPGVMPPPTILNFGDGSSPMPVNGPYPVTVPHTYLAPGTYTVTLTLLSGLPLASTMITILNPTFSLTASPSSVVTGQAVYFTASTGGPPVPGTFIAFGDGTSAPAPGSVSRVPHRYATPGEYTAQLLVVGQGSVFATATVTVSANPVRVPLGEVYSTFLVGSPILAGADTSISLTYRIITPFALGQTGLSPLQAIVELADSRGNVVQRSDPFTLPFSQQMVNAVQTVMIPYTVPADCNGNYLIRVYVRADQGGTVAVGRAQPLQIIGGPDPAPLVSNAFHASGAILTRSGATPGGYNVNLGITSAIQWSTEELLLTGSFDPVSKRIDPLVTLQSATPAPIVAPQATQAPNASTTQVDSGQIPAPPTNTGPTAGESPSPAPATTPGGETAKTPTPSATSPPTPVPSATPAHAPTSEGAVEAPPQVTVSASPAPIATPPAASTSATPPPSPQPQPQPLPPPPAQPGLQFKDVLGRTDASLPTVIGSKETVRGIDANYALPSGWTFHGGAGFFQLASASTTERSGELFDITKSWSGGANDFRVAVTRNQDNVNKFVPTGMTGPLDVSAGVFEFTESLTPHVKAFLTGGKSYTRDETGMTQNVNDSVGKADLNYNVGSTTFDVEYHNAGPQFGTLSGATALTDRAGGTASLNFSTSPISTVSFNYGHDVVRSLFSATSNAVATFNITPQNAPGVTFTLERDRAVAPGADSTTKTINLGISKTGISSISLTGTLAAVSDAIQAESYSTTRTGVVTYQYSNGAHTLGAGINATNSTSANPTSTFTESLNYGFTFGGQTPPNTTGQPLAAGTRYFETKFTLANVNMHSLMSGGHTATFTGLVSWHVTPQLAPGLEGTYEKHYDVVPGMNTQDSFLRFRLDVNI